ncbi:hypothetical protein [Falsiroseomonas oryzae]|uniref:hypothetical protein n=1 Tax=Falsiroseomonas oryzae TaxID=2766473 RepID=UPI0022EB154A|nr:hypothetical protein [Roseomonas sp. MO-31]
MTRAALALLALALALPARAEEEPLLEDPPGLVGVEPTAPGGATLTLGGGYERARNGRARDTYIGGLEAELGQVDGLDLRVQQAVAYGRAAPSDPEATAPSWGGATQLGLRWRLMEGSGPLPSVGVWGALSTAYGRSRPTEDATLLALLAWRLREGERPIALTANLGGSFRLDPEPGERPAGYELSAGLAFGVARDTSLGLSYARIQQDRGERDANLVQAGVWHRLAERGPILGVVAGAGIGRDSPSLLAGITLKFLFGAE